MQHLVSVALLDAVQQLVQVFLNLHVFQSTAGVKQLFQILVEVLENQSELLVSVQHVNQSHDVRVLQLFQQSDFTDSCGWDAFLFGLKSDLFESVDLACFRVLCLIDDTIGTLSDHVDLVVLFDAGVHWAGQVINSW